MNNENQMTQLRNDVNTQSKFWGTLVLTGIFLLVVFYFILSLLNESKTLVGYIGMGIFIAAGVSALISAVFTFRRQEEFASKIIFYTLIFVGIMISLVFQGRVMSASLSILGINALTIWQLLPKHSRRWYSILTVAAMAIMWAVEWINPPWRVVVQVASIGPIAASLFAVILTGIVVLRALGGNLRTKLVTAFLAVTIIPLIIIALVNNNNSRQALTDDANAKLYAASQQTAAQLDQFVLNEINAIRTDAQFAAVVDYVSLPSSQRAGSPEEERLLRYLAGASRRDPIFSDSIAIIDKNGRTLADTEASQIGTNRSDRIYFQQVLKTNAPYASDLEYDEINGKPSLYFAAPIHNSAGKIIGVIRQRYNAAILMEFISAQKDLVGPDSFAVLLDEYDMRLAHAVNPELVFKLVAPLDPALTVDLQSKRLLPQGTNEQIATLDRQDFKDGLTNYLTQPFFQADLSGEGGLEQVAVTRMKTQNWKVAFAQEQSAFLAPITAQTRNNILLTLGVGILVGLVGFIVSQSLSGPIVRLTQTAETIAGGDINIQAKVETNDEIGILAGTFNRMTAQLREFINTLESRVAERTRNLELAAEVGRTVSQVRALDVMLTDAAELIRQQFDLYYVQVYLVNPSQTYLNLQAGTGVVGKELLSRNHRLAFDMNSINGRAAVGKKSVVITNTAHDPNFKPNPLLPETHSEMAVPLLVGEKVVGVLDMQSEHGGALSADILPAFEALAGQLAIAIQNANFLAETERARAEVESQARRLSRTNWNDYLDAIHKPEETGYVFEQNRVAPLTQMNETQTTENSLVAPISVTGETLGKLVVELEGRSPIARTGELIESVSRLVSQQIENLRLLESAERYRAEAEEASRRLTREGWRSYLESHPDKNMGYIYDLKEVLPYSGNGHNSEAYTLPLKVRDESIGKLSVLNISPDDKEAVELINSVAERLSTHIESLRQFEETQRGQVELDKRAKELQAVAEISTQASVATSIQEMLEKMVQLTQEKFDLYHTHIYLFSDDKSELVLTAGAGEVGKQMVAQNRRIKADAPHSLVARAAREKYGVISNDVTKEQDFLPNPLLPETKSEMAVPILVGDEVLGVFDVQGNVINRFTDEDIAIKTTLARQVAVTLQNLRSFSRAQKQAEREAMLNTISQKIQSATTVEAVLQIAARELGHALGAPMTVAQLSMKETN